MPRTRAASAREAAAPPPAAGRCPPCLVRLPSLALRTLCSALLCCLFPIQVFVLLYCFRRTKRGGGDGRCGTSTEGFAGREREGTCQGYESLGKSCTPSFVQVQQGSPLGETRKKGSAKTELQLSDDATGKRCSAGSCEKSNLEEQTEAIGNSDAAEMEWEEGHVLEHKEEYSHEPTETVTVEFNDVPSSTNKKNARRPTAEEKELAELVHRVHLLCLIARGRVIDRACNDPLIQVFHRTFCVTAQSTNRGSFESNLAFAVQDRTGTAEEVCALSVALFRALNLTARFVTNLDVAGLKPDTKETGTNNQDAARLCTRALPSSSPVSDHDVISSAFLQDKTEDSVSMDQQRGNHGKSKQTPACKRNLSKSLSIQKGDNGRSCASTSKDNPTSSQLPVVFQ
ncbi:hypothetical protein PR202_ga21011 [Eleusine coracana subsp. coracana]|uniref:Uncharacterized protein n=1 Tax=Eleusine coracana subsp. coracana TaxID=191504 RepID=A0AAV5CZY4_ELECO|nr:hypothetical protein PR202_ga21011 [Eleusine coracana subsp. coracana]